MDCYFIIDLLMFKKKNIEKKTNISKDLEQITTPNPNDERYGSSSNQSRKINQEDKQHRE